MKRPVVRSVVKWVIVLFLLAPFSLFPLVGWLLFRNGIRMVGDQQQFISNGAQVEGRVIGFENYVSGGRSVSQMTRPVVEYVIDGARYVVSNTVGSSVQTLGYGDEVTVIYDPNDPSHAVLNTISNKWFASGMLLLVGGGAIAFPVGIALFIVYGLVRGRYLKTR